MGSRCHEWTSCRRSCYLVSCANAAARRCRPSGSIHSRGSVPGLLTPADQARLLEIDKTYREAASSLGLMDLKPPKAKAIQRTREKMRLWAEDQEI